MARKQKPKTQSDSCPNCGYCPHCGRAAKDAAPVYVPVWPWWNQPTYIGPTWIYPTVTTSSGTISTTDTVTVPSVWYNIDNATPNGTSWSFTSTQS